MKVRASRVRRAAARYGHPEPKLDQETEVSEADQLRCQRDRLMLELEMLESRQKHQLMTLQSTQDRADEADIRIKLNDKLIQFLLGDLHKIDKSKRCLKIGSKQMQQDAKLKRMLAKIYPEDETAQN